MENLMKSSRIFGVVATVLSSALGIGSVATGCGSGDDSGTAAPGGADATADAVHEDSPSGDGGTGDASAKVDSSLDGTVAVDGASTTDGASIVDATTVDADGGLTDGDASTDATGTTDAVADAGPDSSALLAFPTQLAAAVCQSYAACCFGADAAAFDQAKCMSQQIVGGPGGVNADTTILDAGHVTFNQTSATACLARINSITAACPGANSLTGPAYSALLQDCFAALSGTLDAGAPCQAAVECTTGNFCLKDGGAGPGVCSPLRTTGGPCGDLGNTDCNFITSLEESACSYRGSGNTDSSCSYIEWDAGPACFPASQWTCQPQGALNAQCAVDVDCQSTSCDPNANTCVNARQWIPALACTDLTIVDAGGQ